MEKRSGATHTKKIKSAFTVKNLVLIAMFGALAAVLMLFEFPLPFLAPSFYELDLSEIPVLIGTFMMGPVAGVLIEAVKILIKLLLKPTSTAFVGELANFCVGCALAVPAGIIYRTHKTKKRAVIGLCTGTLAMALAAVILNTYVMLPFYTTAFHMPLDAIIGAGTEIIPFVNSTFTFMLFCVAPFNIIKGVLTSLVVVLCYKRISVLLRS